MPPKKNKRSSRKPRRILAPSELPTSSIAYPRTRWPSDVARARTGNNTCTVLLATESALTTSGSGIINSVYTDIVTGVNNWSSFAAVFDSYRVLAVRVQFTPLRAVGGSTVTYFAPIATAIDRSDSTVLSSYLAAMQYSSHREFPGNTQFSVLSCMASAEDATFLSTQAPAARCWIKTYSTGNTISTTIGRVVTELLVQFRQVGI